MEFVNAQERAIEYPDSFHAPDTQQMMRKLKTGDFVKICAEGLPGEYPAERFWLEVDVIKPDRITGTIASYLLYHSLDRGDRLTVGPEHIFQYECRSIK